MQRILFMLLFLIAAFCYAQPQTNHALPLKLPVFTLAPSKVTEKTVSDLTVHLFGERVINVTKKDDRLISTSGTKVLQVSLKSGGIWFEDKSQLWNPKIQPLPTLPDANRAKELAKDYLNKVELIPPMQGPFSSMEFANMGGTWMSRYDLKTKKRDPDQQLDIEVNYYATIKPLGDNGPAYPVVGGGGDLNFTFGDQGKLIGYQTCWRPIQAIQKNYNVIPQQKADKQFVKIIENEGYKLESFSSSLAYYSAPPSDSQSFLYPVYAFKGTIKSGKREMAVRITLLPATDFGPDFQKVQATRERHDSDHPLAGATDPEQPNEEAKPYEAGVSWIGNSDGLDSKDNVDGFVRELRDDNWQINFNWNDDNAWETDWIKNDDDWVDSADIVFFTGHAEKYDWSVHEPTDFTVDASEVGPEQETPGDLWGEQDLEWIIIAGCGPLEDDRTVNRGGNAADRWKGAFDGLHLLLGYASTSYANKKEGETVAKYMKADDTIIHSWFQAAREVQSNRMIELRINETVWIGALYAETDDSDTSNDHLWGHGTVAADPRPPRSIVVMFTST